MKRWCALITALCLLTGLFGGCSSAGPETKALTAEELTELKASRQETQAQTMPVICINGVAAIYETEENCYYWSVGSEDKWETFSVTLSGEADKDKKTAFTEDFTKTRKSLLLRKNEPVSVIVYDDTAYQLYSLKFSTLPLLSIQTQQLPDNYQYADWTGEPEAEEAPDLTTVAGKIEAVKAQDDEEPVYDPHNAPPDDPENPIGEEDVFAQITLLDPSAAAHGYENGLTSMARLHQRGRSSKAYPKNSYKLELLNENKENPSLLDERKKTLLGMRDDGDWVLNGMYAEPTKMRDKIASQVWLNITADRTTTGISTGYRMEYIEVFINGRYWGLYMLSERIDQKQLALEDGDLMYFSEGDLGKHYYDFEKAKDEDMEVSGYSLTFPKERTAPYEEWQSFADFVKLIDNTNQKTFTDTAANMIDLNSAADYWIFAQTTSGVDNLIQNTYYVAQKQEDGSFKYSFIPWDMDQTFGNRWSGQEPLYTAEDYSTVNQVWSFWVTSRLINCDAGGFNELVKERYATLRESAISNETLFGLIEEAQKQVTGSGAFARNQARWPDGGYQNNLGDMRRYISSRMSYFDSAIDGICQKQDESDGGWGSWWR